VQLDDLIFNSPSWADDLLLISTTESGLQKCLDNLQGYCTKWALEVNEEETKFMVMNHKNSNRTPNIYYNKLKLEQVSSFKYLGVILQNNGKYNLAIKDRINKANRALFLIKQAITTNENVSIKLALSIFDKMVAPILLYGCAVWSLPICTNYVYIKNIDNNERTSCTSSKSAATSIINSLCGKSVGLQWTKYLPTKKDNKAKTILVNLKSYSDKELLLNKYNCSDNNANSFIIENYEFDPENTDLEKFHNNYCKFVLNITKKSSTNATKYELGRHPLYYSALTHNIKFWHRLEMGTPNLFVNKAYMCCKNENHPWIQSVQSLMNTNGLNENFNYPTLTTTDSLGHKIKQRLYDQNIQNTENKIKNSTRFSNE
jgi:hypothetical protein